MPDPAAAYPGVLGDLGEFAAIARIAAALGAPPSPAGPGDDAAVVPVGGRPDLVATTDLLVEGRHFRLDAGWSTPTQVGRKAAAANLADVAAMGARPVALLVGLAAPASLPLAAVDGLTAGLREECVAAGALVVGGDLVRHEAVVLAVTALGDLDGRPPVTRAGARAGDVVVVAGSLGWSAAGLALLLAGRADDVPAAAAYHRAPHPSYALGPVLARAGATSMIDVSDGLAQDLGHVADASGVGIDLDRRALRTAPWSSVVLDAAEALGVDPDGWLLTGGEEHSLVATLPTTVAVPAGCTVIGRVGGAPGVWADGRPVTGGYDHFAG